MRCATCGEPITVPADESELPIHTDTGSPFAGYGSNRHVAMTELEARMTRAESRELWQS